MVCACSGGGGPRRGGHSGVHGPGNYGGGGSERWVWWRAAGAWRRAGLEVGDNPDIWSPPASVRERRGEGTGFSERAEKSGK